MAKKKWEPSPYQLSLWDDVDEEAELDRCVDHIRADLGVGSAPDYETVMDLMETLHVHPQPAAVRTGDICQEAIRVNPRLPLGKLAIVLLHELVHRLCHGPRYEELNPVHTRRSRREFLEAVACRVAGDP